MKVCIAGFKGTDCKERDVQGEDPECSTLGPCKNGGNCWNKTCCCAKGYEGPFCGIDIIECRSNPCVNGVCKEGGIGEYKCICPEGKIQFAHTGVNVQKISLIFCINVLMSRRLDYIGSYRCKCPEGMSKLVHTDVNVQKIILS